jgi:hypothetical protein
MNRDTTGDVHLPAPSIWPAVVGAGITLLAFGLLPNLLFSAVGALLLVAGIAGWIGELRHG